MKWTKERPKTDQTRWVKRFAFLPTEIAEAGKFRSRVQTYVWLQFYWEKQCTYGNWHWCFAGTYLNSEQEAQECVATKAK